MGGGVLEREGWGCDLKIIGHRSCGIHCRRSYGVPKSKVVVGGRWGRAVGTGGVWGEGAIFSYR